MSREADTPEPYAGGTTRGDMIFYLFFNQLSRIFFVTALPKLAVNKNCLPTKKEANIESPKRHDLSRRSRLEVPVLNGHI
jgi:hypothetical protein